MAAFFRFPLDTPYRESERYGEWGWPGSFDADKPIPYTGRNRVRRIAGRAVAKPRQFPVGDFWARD